MKTKERKIKLDLKFIICINFMLFLIIFLIILYNKYIPLNKSYAKETSAQQEEQIKISKATGIDIDKIISQNIKNAQTEKITQKEEVLEYLTKYRTNKEVPKGISYVVQEGREGKQEISIKTIYDEYGNIILEEPIKSNIIKAPANKIVEVGGANYTSNYKVKVGDMVYVTSDVLGVWSEANENSRKIMTLKQNDSVKVLEIVQNWFKISNNNVNGWVKSECTVYINLKEEVKQSSEKLLVKSKKQLLSELNINMQLNKPSGLTLEQFKKVLTDEKDLNKIFISNSEYFYYIEKQYNINGLFVAAVAIHESDWGTSKIAIEKNNLFGYGASDSNPFNNAYVFSNYSESIDLIARVFVKYYLNPSGTTIFGGEVAVGTYYNGTTLSGVNTKYATDKNWASAVFSHIKYLYNKL